MPVGTQPGAELAAAMGKLLRQDTGREPRVWSEMGYEGCIRQKDLRCVGSDADLAREMGRLTRTVDPGCPASWIVEFLKGLQAFMDEDLARWLSGAWNRWEWPTCTSHGPSHMVRDIAWRIDLNWDADKRESAIQDAISDAASSRTDCTGHCGCTSNGTRSWDRSLLLVAWNGKAPAEQTPLLIPELLDLGTAHGKTWQLEHIIWEGQEPQGLIARRVSMVTATGTPQCSNQARRQECLGPAGHRCPNRHQASAHPALWKVAAILGIQEDLFSSQAHRDACAGLPIWGTDLPHRKDDNCLGNAFNFDWSGRKAFIHPPQGKKVYAEMIITRIEEAIKKNKNSLFLVLCRKCDHHMSPGMRVIAETKTHRLAVHAANVSPDWIINVAGDIMSALHDWPDCSRTSWLGRMVAVERNKRSTEVRIRDAEDRKKAMAKIERAEVGVSTAPEEEKETKTRYLQILLAQEAKRRSNRHDSDLSDLVALKTKYPSEGRASMDHPAAEAEPTMETRQSWWDFFHLNLRTSIEFLPRPSTILANEQVKTSRTGMMRAWLVRRDGKQWLDKSFSITRTGNRVGSGEPLREGDVVEFRPSISDKDAMQPGTRTGIFIDALACDFVLKVMPKTRYGLAALQLCKWEPFLVSHALVTGPHTALPLTRTRTLKEVLLNRWASSNELTHESETEDTWREFFDGKAKLGVEEMPPLRDKAPLIPGSGKPQKGIWLIRREDKYWTHKGIQMWRGDRKIDTGKPTQEGDILEITLLQEEVDDFRAARSSRVFIDTLANDFALEVLESETDKVARLGLVSWPQLLSTLALGSRSLGSCPLPLARRNSLSETLLNCRVECRRSDKRKRTDQMLEEQAGRKPDPNQFLTLSRDEYTPKVGAVVPVRALIKQPFRIPLNDVRVRDAYEAVVEIELQTNASRPKAAVQKAAGLIRDVMGLAEQPLPAKASRTKRPAKETMKAAEVKKLRQLLSVPSVKRGRAFWKSPLMEALKRRSVILRSAIDQMASKESSAEFRKQLGDLLKQEEEHIKSENELVAMELKRQRDFVTKQQLAKRFKSDRSGTLRALARSEDRAPERPLLDKVRTALDRGRGTILDGAQLLAAAGGKLAMIRTPKLSNQWSVEAVLTGWKAGCPSKEYDVEPNREEGSMVDQFPPLEPGFDEKFRKSLDPGKKLAWLLSGEKSIAGMPAEAVKVPQDPLDFKSPRQVD
jgi:hypothetical protein